LEALERPWGKLAMRSSPHLVLEFHNGISVFILIVDRLTTPFLLIERDISMKNVDRDQNSHRPTALVHNASSPTH